MRSRMPRRMRMAPAMPLMIAAAIACFIVLTRRKTP
jgi:hypothetical protein